MSEDNQYSGLIRTSGYYPGSHAYREAKRRWHGYETSQQAGASTFTKTVSKWNNIGRTRLELIADARMLETNDGVVRGIVDKMTRQAIGEGIRPYSLCEDNEERKKIDKLFEWWSTKFADQAGLLDIPGLERMISRRMDVDGDVAILYTYTEVKINGKIEKIPSFRLIESFKIGGTKEDLNVYDGVKIDKKTGRPLRYYVYDGPDNQELLGHHTGNLPKKSYEAFTQMILISDSFQIDQYRGHSKLGPCISDVMDLQDIIDYEKEAIRRQALFAFKKVTDDINEHFGAGQSDEELMAQESATRGYGINTYGGHTGNLDLDFREPGGTATLKPGEDFKGFEVTRPAAGVEVIERILLHKVAHCFNLPYEEAISPTGLTGTGQRTTSVQAEKVYKDRQDLIEKKFCHIVWHRFMKWAVLSGRIKPVKGFDQVDWGKTSSKGSIDIGKDTKADIENVSAGFETVDDIVIKRGQNPRVLEEKRKQQAIRTVKAVHEIMKETGLEYQDALNLYGRTDVKEASLKIDDSVKSVTKEAIQESKDES